MEDQFAPIPLTIIFVNDSNKDLNNFIDWFNPSDKSSYSNYLGMVTEHGIQIALKNYTTIIFDDAINFKLAYAMLANAVSNNDVFVSAYRMDMKGSSIRASMSIGISGEIMDKYKVEELMRAGNESLNRRNQSNVLKSSCVICANRSRIINYNVMNSEDNIVILVNDKYNISIIVDKPELFNSCSNSILLDKRFSQHLPMQDQSSKEKELDN